MSRAAKWSSVPPWTRVALFGLLYFGGSELGYAQILPTVGCAFWPPGGLAVAALLLSPRRLWLWLVGVSIVASYPSDMLHGGNWTGSLWMSTWNAIAFVTSAWLLQLLIDDPDLILTRLRPMMLFVAIAGFGGTMIAASAGTFHIWLFYRPMPAFWERLLLFWFGDILGVLIVAPAVLAVPTIARSLVGSKRFASEFALMLAVLVAVVFIQPARSLQSQPWPVMLVLFWVAMRAGPPAMAFCNLVLALLAVFFTYRHTGPLAHPEAPAESLFGLYFFLGSVSVIFLIVAIIVNERKDAMGRLAFSEERFRAMVECGPVAAYMRDVEGRFLYVNPVYLAASGLPLDTDPVGRTLFDLWPEPFARQLQEADNDLFAAGAPRDYLTLPPANGGEQRYWRNCKVPYIDAAGRLFVVGIGIEVTQQHKAEQEMRRALVAAEAASRAKNEFLSRTSHELRTPLNAVLGFAQLLEVAALPSDQRESVRHILRAGWHLVRLIDDLLDVARIESGQLTFAAEPIALDDAVREARAQIDRLAATRSVSVSVDLGACAGRCILADPRRLHQILLNLMTNAVKYNRDGGAVFVAARDLGDGSLAVDVRDTGQGVPEAKRVRLFQPFDRLDAEKESTIEGVGLGLAVSQSLAVAMGGRLLLANGDGEGATFTVVLPEAASLLEPLPAVTAISTPRGRRVLLVEDNQANAQLIASIFDRFGGVTLLTAARGEAGLAVCGQPLDLVLLDLHLPDMMGDEFLTRLRQMGNVAPVVILSADATRERITELLQAGAAHYLTKPFDIDEFLRVVEAALACPPSA